MVKTKNQLKKEFRQAHIEKINEQISTKEMLIQKFLIEEKDKIKKLIIKRNEIFKELEELQ